VAQVRLGVKKVLAIDYSRCTGCHLCELACATKHYGVVNPYLARVTVMTQPESPLSIPSVCMQCRDAPCARVCPVNAIRYDEETGAYLIDEARCIGCLECAYVCPYGAIGMDMKGEVIKCDLCGGDPECVKVCPHEALIYGPANKVLPKISRRRAVLVAGIVDAEKILVKEPTETVEKAKEAVKFLYKIWEKVGKKPT